MFGASAGMPMTQIAPITAAVTEPIPPMTTMATRASEPSTKNGLPGPEKATLAKAPLSSAPPSPARAPAMAKARIFSHAGRTV